MKYFYPIFVICCFVGCESVMAQIISRQSGSWSDAATWIGNEVPDSNDNVQVAAGNIISIENTSCVCRDVAFADTSSHLRLPASTSMLNVYGNFSLSGSAHHAFSEWAPGATVRFCGAAATQLISGWGSGTPPTSLMEIVVDKSDGKVTTPGANMHLAIGNLLHIVRGTFELALSDDIETRNLQGVAVSTIITVDSAGKMNIAGGDSYIRRGAFTNADSARTGSWFIKGSIQMASTSSSRLNIGNLRIENGGTLIIKPDWSSNCLNAGQITVTSAGRILNQTTKNVWYPASVVLIEPDGQFETQSITTSKPLNFTLNGILNYSGCYDQIMCQGIISYPELRLSGSGVKTMTANVIVLNSLRICDTASLVLNGYSLTYSDSACLIYNSAAVSQTTSNYEWPLSGGPQNVEISNPNGVSLHAPRSIEKSVLLTQGLLNYNGFSLTINDGAAIIRKRAGRLSAEPLFSGIADFKYINLASIPMAADVELPVSANIINDLSLSGNGPLMLTKNITINGALLLSNTNLYTSVNEIGFSGTAVNPIENNGAMIVGQAKMLPRYIGSGMLGFISVALNGGGDLGTVSVKRTTGHCVKTQNSESISSFWEIESGGLTAGSREELELSWFSVFDNGKEFSASNKAVVWYSSDGGVTWMTVGEMQDVSETNPRRIRVQYLGSGFYSVGDSYSLPGSRISLLNLDVLIEALWNGFHTVTDTLLVRLHSAGSPYSMAAESKGSFDSSGKITLRFTDLNETVQYYVSVVHRNSIETWTAAPVVFAGGVCTYDFTSAANRAYGSNLTGKAGRYCIYSGDVNKDGAINYSDIRLIDSDMVIYRKGYLAADLNGDQGVDISDIMICDNNAMKNIVVRRP